MSTIKIPKGCTAVLVVNALAADENTARSRTPGARFVPSWFLYLQGPEKKLPADHDKLWVSTRNDGTAVARYGVYSFDGRVRPEFAVKFPHSWAPAELATTNVWLSPSDETTFNLTQE